MRQDFSVSTQDTQLITPPVQPDWREIEVKFLTTDAGFKAAQQWPVLNVETAPGRAQRLRTIYFDTANRDLERQKIALRIRRQQRSWVMTLKWAGSPAGGLFERGEIEVAAASDVPELSLFTDEIAAMLERILAGQALIAVFETDIRRVTRHIASGTSNIEIAFDSGHIIAGEQKLPVREIELELKSGDPAELYRHAIALAHTFPVSLGTQAKSERGALLASGEPPLPVRASSPLAGAPTVDEGIAAIINGCIAQFTGNWAAFEAGDTVTAIHQMRVALRRLRSLLGLFHRAFPCAEFAAFRLNAKDIAATLGEARNWDVFLQLLRDGPVSAFPEFAGFASILAQSEQQRDIGYEAVGRLLAAPETTCFILSLQAFIVRHGWRNAASPDALVRLTEPAKTFAAANLNRMQTRLTKRHKKLGHLAAVERHEIRIKLKKFRYAADLFAGLFPSAQLRDHTRITAKLQNQLGIFNDLITAHDMVARLDISAPETNFATGIITGWCGRGAQQDDEALSGAWKKFRKLRALNE